MIDEQAETVAWDGPAILTNKMVVAHTSEGIVRVVFLDQAGPDAAPVFRAAVAMSIPDTKKLVKILTEILQK